MTAVAITGVGVFAGTGPVKGARRAARLDHHSAIALTACQNALTDSGLDVEEARAVGVTMATTVGSLRSMTDYTRDTFLEERPYYVDPGLFPNTVMNAAAGQVGIRHGLRGMNLTVAGGSIAFASSVRLAARALRFGQLDAMIVGAAEERRPHPSWGIHAAARSGGAAVIVERADEASRSGRHVDALVESTAIGFAPGGEAAGRMLASLTECAGRALAAAGAPADAVATVIPCAPAGTAGRDLGIRAVRAVLTGTYEMSIPLPACERRGSAGAALEVASLLMRHRDDPGRDGDRSLVLGWTVEGGVSATVLRGFARPIRPSNR